MILRGMPRRTVSECARVVGARFRPGEGLDERGEAHEPGLRRAVGEARTAGCRRRTGRWGAQIRRRRAVAVRNPSCPLRRPPGTASSAARTGGRPGGAGPRATVCGRGRRGRRRVRRGGRREPWGTSGRRDRRLPGRPGRRSGRRGGCRGGSRARPLWGRRRPLPRGADRSCGGRFGGAGHEGGQPVRLRAQSRLVWPLTTQGTAGDGVFAGRGWVRLRIRRGALREDQMAVGAAHAEGADARHEPPLGVRPGP